MRSGGPKAIPAAGPPGPSAVTRASALQDVVAAIKAVLTAADLPSARAALGLGNVANLAPADLGISTAAAAAIANLASLVSANQTALTTILGGANPAVDTFIEAYNRFLSDESAAAALTATVGALQTALTAETTRATAAEGTNATAISNEVTRATGVEGTLALKARQIATSGLATGGGDLSADRTINVPKASQADVATGTDDAKALTAYAAAARFGLTAPLASPAFTGSPTAPTASAGTNTVQIATCAFVASALGSYLSTAAAASTYAPLSSPALTGTPTAATAAAGTSTTQLATTGFVSAALGAYLTAAAAASTYATLASPALTGTPTAPTASAGTNTTQIATTAFVLSAVSSGSVSAVTYTAQSLTGGQQDQVRVNVGGAVLAAPSASATLATTDIERPLNPTGVITLTMPNGGAGWRSGTIKNANTATGLVTLAVPSGATLDGVTNGTTVLFPYQRARIIQTGATAYITDQSAGDRAPILGTVTIASPVASFDLIVPDGYPRLRLRGSNISLSATANLGLRFGDAGGVKTGASDYYSQRTQSFGASTIQGRGLADSYGYLTAGEVDASSVNRAMLDVMIHAGLSGSYPGAMGQAYEYDGTDPQVLLQVGAFYTGGTSGAMSRATLMRIFPSTGNINTGSFTLTGEP